MIKKINQKGEQNKVCKNNIFIFKIPLTYFLPVTRKINSSKFPAYGNFGCLIPSCTYFFVR